MSFTRAIYASTTAAGVGVAGLFGVGLGAASADPGRPYNAPGAPACQVGQANDRGHGDNRGPAPVDWQHRGIGQARNDHQPFNWNGQHVTPMPAGNDAAWGFWFLGPWIPL